MKRFLSSVLILSSMALSGCLSADVIECGEDCMYDAPEYGNSYLPGGDDDVIPQNNEPNDNIVSGNVEMDECNNSCDIGELCIGGTCVVQCPDGEIECDGSCINPRSFNMIDCHSCMSDWCDSDRDMSNGCELYAKGYDDNNCGSCGHQCNEDEICMEGTCTDICSRGELLCGTQCVKPDQLHIDDCNTCSRSYCDSDNNLLNGCEIYVLGSDAENCGSCGHACNSGESCIEGRCKSNYLTHRVMILVGKDSLNVRKGVGTSYDAIGKLYTYEYVTVYEEKDSWLRIDYNGQEGWISKNYTMDAGDDIAGRAAIDIAEKFLYTKNPGYCTYDFLTHEPKIQNFYDLYKYGDEYNYGYNDNCANFVTSSLKTAGLIAKNIIGVKKIYNYCNEGTEGYHMTTIENAKPGDIWMNSSLGHTELIVGNFKGQLILIGSNNFSSSETLKGLCVNTHYTNSKYASSPSKYQRVSYGSATSGYVCTRQ